MEMICLPVGLIQANCYILWDDEGRGVVLDPGGDSEKILKVIRENRIEVEHILLTHAHIDHMTGVPEVQTATGADLMIHRADAPALWDPKLSLYTEFGVPFHPMKADRLLEDKDLVTAGKLNLQVIHTPGHTPGGACFLCEDALFTGDTLFRDGFGRTDWYGGSVDAMLRSLHKLARLPEDYKVFPGHGPDTTLFTERESNPYMTGNAYYDIEYTRP